MIGRESEEILLARQNWRLDIDVPARLVGAAEEREQMPRPKHRSRIAVYTDSLSQRVVEHLTVAEAYARVERQPHLYEWTDDSHRSLRVRTKQVVLRPQIACTITTSELLINAGLMPASEPKVVEVREKLSVYNDTNKIPVGLYCPWPRTHTSFSKPISDDDRLQLEHPIDPQLREAYLVKLGLYNSFS